MLGSWAKQYFDEDIAFNRLLAYVNRYPDSQVRDVYIWLHQSVFCSQVYPEKHVYDLVQDLKKQTDDSSDEYLFFEPIGLQSEYVRVYLHAYYLFGGPLLTIQELARKSVERAAANPMLFKSHWNYFTKWVEEGRLTYSREEINSFDKEQAVHENKTLEEHSGQYRASYDCMYKVVRWDLFLDKFSEFAEQEDKVFFWSRPRYE